MAIRFRLSMPIFVLPLAHSHWKSLVTWTDLPNGHIGEHAIKDGESATSVQSLSRMKSLACETNLSVHTSCKEHGVLDPCACQTGHDMPAGLASLTQFLCCASHNSAMEMPRVLSSAHAISMTSVQRVLDQPVCSMLVYYIARPDSQFLCTHVYFFL